jgi:hypothetical protein
MLSFKNLAISLLITTLCSIVAIGQTQSQPVDPGQKSQNSIDESVDLTPVQPETNEVPQRWKAKPLAFGSERSLKKTNGKAEVTLFPKPKAPDEDKWQFQFTPYLWIAGLNGTAGRNGFNVDISSGITDSNVHLNFGFMGTFEARKNRWVLLTDLQYSNLGTDRPSPGPLFSGASASFKTFVLDPEVGYEVAGNPEKGNLIDVLGGIRIWHLRANLDFFPGVLAGRSFTASRNWVDAVGGIRARIHLSPRWFLSGKADVGGGGTKLTYQLYGGGGYLITKKIAIVGAYRDLYVKYDRDNFLFRMSISGPIIGAGFKF